jgi:hypothetical protein
MSILCSVNAINAKLRSHRKSELNNHGGEGEILSQRLMRLRRRTLDTTCPDIFCLEVDPVRRFNDGTR